MTLCKICKQPFVTEHQEVWWWDGKTRSRTITNKICIECRVNMGAKKKVPPEYAELEVKIDYRRLEK